MPVDGDPLLCSAVFAAASRLLLLTSACKAALLGHREPGHFPLKYLRNQGICA